MVGLTGGIGSGKSAVAARLAELGAVIVDSDRIAREVVQPGTDGLREIVEVFGDRVLGADGSLDRPALGAVVFGDDAARARLEGIIHPRVRARSAELVAAGRRPTRSWSTTYRCWSRWGSRRRTTWFRWCGRPGGPRVERLVRDRGMTAEQAEQRIPGADRRRRAAGGRGRRTRQRRRPRRAARAGRHRLAGPAGAVRTQRPGTPGGATRPGRRCRAGPGPACPDRRADPARDRLRGADRPHRPHRGARPAGDGRRRRRPRRRIAGSGGRARRTCWRPPAFRAARQPRTAQPAPTNACTAAPTPPPPSPCASGRPLPGVDPSP